VTKAISAPIANGFSGGVSVGIRTKEQKKLSLDDGIFQDEVALHFQIGQNSKGVLIYGRVDALLTWVQGLTPYPRSRQPYPSCARYWWTTKKRTTCTERQRMGAYLLLYMPKMK
jgi:hypothetical protein